MYLKNLSISRYQGMVSIGSIAAGEMVFGLLNDATWVWLPIFLGSAGVAAASLLFRRVMTAKNHPADEKNDNMNENEINCLKGAKQDGTFQKLCEPDAEAGRLSGKDDAERDELWARQAGGLGTFVSARHRAAESGRFGLRRRPERRGASETVFLSPCDSYRLFSAVR